MTENQLRNYKWMLFEMRVIKNHMSDTSTFDLCQMWCHVGGGRRDEVHGDARRRFFNVLSNGISAFVSDKYAVLRRRIECFLS